MNKKITVSKTDKKSTLQQQIDSKIAGLKEIECDLPGAIIIHNLKDSSVVYMNSWGCRFLGVSVNQLQKMKAKYHSQFFNPEDAKDYVPKIFGLLERNNDDEFVSFFQQVRKSPKHEWRWYLSSTKIFFRDETGNPLLTLTIALPVDAQHHMVNKAIKLLEESNFTRAHAHIFNSLTKREKEILKLMAMGFTSSEMAKKLHISEMTASTHRRNVKNKLQAQNNYDIARFARAFDLI